MPVYNYKALPSGDILTQTAPTEALAESFVGTAGVDYDADYGFVNIAEDEAQILSEDSIPPTSVLSGLTVTASGATDILISAGTGIINDYSVPESPAVFPLVWSDDAKPYAIPDIGTDGYSLVYLDRNLEPFFVYGTTLTGYQAAINRRDSVFLASVAHSAGAITRITAAKVTGRETYHQLLDFFTALGIFNAGGFDITPTVTGFSTSSGFLMSIGAGNGSNDRLENFIEILAQSPTTFTEFLGSTGTPIITQASTSVMNVTDYDDGGVLTTIPASGRAVIKYLFMVPVDTGQNISIMHGQTVYATEQEAIANAEADYANIIIPDSFARNSLLLARWVVEDGADLTAPAQSQRLSGAIFGTRIGVGGNGTVGGGGDYFGTPSSVTNGLVTSASTSGKTASTDADITALNGVFQRITPAGGLTIEDSVFNAGDTLVYPTADGLAGDKLTTDAAGNLTLDSDVFKTVTTSQTLDYDDKYIYIDTSAGDMTLTLGDNPRDGEKKLLWMGDNTNVCELVSANPAFPIDPQTPPAEPNIQGMWTLSSDFLDRFAPTDRDLTNSGTGGAFQAATVNGNSVNAFNFQGTAYLEAVASDYRGITGGTARSFTCWYQANAGTPVTDQTIVAWGEDVPTGGFLWEIDFRGSQGYLWINNRNASKRYNMPTLEAVNLFDGNMHHIAVTQSTASMSSVQLYVDGVVIAHDFLDNFPNNQTRGNTVYRIGANYVGGTILDGVLYDARLFNIGLTAQQVEEVRNENILGGVNLSALNNDMIVDVNYNGSEWVIAAGTESLLGSVDGRLVTLEDSAIRGGGSSTENNIVTYADDTGLQASDASDISAVGGILTRQTPASPFVITADGNVSILATNPTSEITLDTGLTTVVMSDVTGNIDISDGADGNANFFFGRIRLRNPSDSPNFALANSVDAVLGGMQWDTDHVNIYHGTGGTNNNELNVYADRTVSTRGITIDTTTEALIPPQVTTAQMNAIAPIGVVTNTDVGILYHGDGAAWNAISTTVSVLGRVIVQSGIALSGIFQPVTTGTFAFFEVNGSPATPTFVNGVWTCPVVGTYQVNISGWAFTGSGSDSQCRFYTAVNGLDYTDPSYPGIDQVTKNGAGLAVNGIVKLEAGDLVQISYSVLSGTGWQLDNFRWDVSRVGS